MYTGPLPFQPRPFDPVVAKAYGLDEIGGWTLDLKLPIARRKPYQTRTTVMKTPTMEAPM